MGGRLPRDARCVAAPAAAATTAGCPARRRVPPRREEQTDSVRQAYGCWEDEGWEGRSHQGEKQREGETTAR